MSKKILGVLIDLGIIFIYTICIFLFIYFGYNHIYKSKIIASIILLLSIPVCWGTIIMSILGKKTIGHRIMSKKHN